MQILILSAACATATAIAAAFCFFPALSFGKRRRIAAFLALGAAIALSPLLVPPEQKATRFLTAVFSVILVAKMWDLHAGALRGDRPDIRNFLAFFANPIFLVFRKEGLERQPQKEKNLRDLGVGALGVGAACTVLLLLIRADWSSWPFLIEHSLKAAGFFFFAVALFRAAAAATRLLGGYTVNPLNSPLAARTPADFWRRYNRLIGLFLYEDVFKLLHGRRHTTRATLIVFAVSALFHEYVFSIAIGRPQGLQTLFFMLQGCAAALTQRVKPTGGKALVWGLGTFVFNITSSVFFFASCHGVIRIYHGGLPQWLRAF